MSGVLSKEQIMGAGGRDFNNCGCEKFQRKGKVSREALGGCTVFCHV